MSARPAWFEYVVDDLPAAKAFYGGLFGWEFVPMDGYPGDYWMLAGPPDPISGGLIQAGPVRRPGGGAVVYVDVEDLDATTTAAVALGGTLVQATTVIEGVGRFTIVADPSGNHVGLWAG